MKVRSVEEVYAWADYWRAYVNGDEDAMREAFQRIHLTEPRNMTKTTQRMKIPFYNTVTKETPK